MCKQYIMVVNNHGELFLIAVVYKETERSSLKVCCTLKDYSFNDKMSVWQFQSINQTILSESINIKTMQKKLSETIKNFNTKFGKEYVQLTSFNDDC